MIVGLDNERAVVTFRGGKFVFQFKHSGLLNKSLIVSCFETDDTLQPMSPNQPLFVAKIPIGEGKVLETIKLLTSVDLGEAEWIPSQYLSRQDSDVAVEKNEEQAIQAAYGNATILLEKKDYVTAGMSITASLLSRTIRKYPIYESRFLRKLAEVNIGMDNYIEAKKAIVRAINICKEDSDFRDLFTLGVIEHKLGEDGKSILHLREFISSLDNEKVRTENKDAIEVANSLIIKIDNNRAS